MKKLKVLCWLDDQVDHFGIQHLAYGLFGVLNFPLSYFMWTKVAPEPYESLFLRMLSAFFCFLLLLKHYWPNRLKPYFTYYWLFTLIFTASFFCTFMLLKNHFSLIWQMNCCQALLILVLLVSWEVFFFCLGIGVLLGVIVFLVSLNLHHIDFASLVDLQWSVSVYMFLYAVLIGGVFSRNRQKIEEAKNNAAYAVGANIAHELRTPLASINAAVSSADKYFLILLQAYELVQKQGLEIEKIPLNKLKLLPGIFANIKEEVNFAHLFINMLLFNVQQNLEVKDNEMASCSVVDVVRHALERFPFDEKQAQLVHFNDQQDFNARMVPLFFEHILFNLLKNALYYIQDVGKGDITIWCELGEKVNYVHFKDTAKGMDKKVLAHLFERFHSNRHQGTGVGLAFCKQMMEAFGGDIYCESVDGEYVHFILEFPKVEKN